MSKIHDIFESDDDEEEEEEEEDEEEKEKNENGEEGNNEEGKEEKDETNEKTKFNEIEKASPTKTKKNNIIDVNEDVEEEKYKPKKQNNTLYGILIEGLAFETTESELKNIFSHYGEIVKIYLPKYRNTPKNIGYCNIYFTKEESAIKALELNNHRIRNRYMEISLSNMRNNSNREQEKIDPDDIPLDCTTAFVKNLAYTVTEKEIEEKFKTCGEINQIRYVCEPQTNKFKGFCYIQFKEHKGLLKALKLNGTSFGARKLYVDYEQGRPKKSYNLYENNYEDTTFLNHKRY